MHDGEPRKAADERQETEPATADPGSRADNLALAALLLGAAATLVDGIHAAVAAAGFDDLRPSHGFAFARIAAGETTVGDVAEHLGVTKQAASQLVEELARKGYLTRRPHPGDARARLLELTARGWACTRAADLAMAALMEDWAAVLGRKRVAALRADLARVVPSGPLRPAAW
ncbi:winged helix-turn-helix transcriptional regulator [Actinocrinis puniceicyclus]|uniref:Winged helix-turn-helix transcriptional regulator n=1 Tax=Actinocrinis puniceicyclus TaxID=977794 RepID=A0A8J7WQM6_9ACTN|nr:MarR family winged helix-turn-helix transcriptional regulator [Actinocrinis puniceicyclus]MBS2965703.1 winged helix-turn-helix transcriptional regulator [Actinocrinis puniceicyclus]